MENGERSKYLENTIEKLEIPVPFVFKIFLILKIQVKS